MELTLMFSYQSDLDKRASANAKQKHHTHTDFLKFCIQKAIQQIERKGDLRYVSIKYTDTTMIIKNDESIEDVVGRLTNSCHIFVADLTCTRKFPHWILGILELLNLNTKNEGNSNVCHEYGLVKNRLGKDRIIKVMNISQGDPNVDDKYLPVDFRNKRFPIGYEADVKDEFGTINKREANAFIGALAQALHAAAVEAVALKATEYLPFIGWEEHSKGFHDRSMFVPSDLFNDIQRKVLTDTNFIIRIKGLSGMGKTRTILEAFRGKEERFNYLYADCYNLEKIEKFKEFYEQLSKIFSDNKNQDLILVIDNCDQSRWRDILDRRRAARSRIKLIGITHDMMELFGPDEMPIELPKSMPEVVAGILDIRKNDYEPKYRERIEQFAGGIPLMAHLLLDGLKENKALGDIDEVTIWDKVFNYRADSEERKMLQTIALFNWIGYEDEKANELEFVATNKDITLLEGTNQVIINRFRGLISEGLQRGYIEQRGRLISIRPKPLAMRLIGEWIKGCDKVRINNVMQALSTHPTLNQTLSSAFGEQLKDMRFLENSNLIIQTIFANGSPFVSAEVLNSELGSHLFRAFVEVDPETIADRLWQILTPLSIEELKSMERGRRNIVWTLEKICFNASTFEKGAEMMLRLSLAETEYFGNNATGQFIRLFYIQLAATEVDYDTRIHFLNRMAEIEEYQPFVLKAIKAALGTSYPVFFSGAEKFGTVVKEYYKPQSYAEVKKYCKDCIDILNSLDKDERYDSETKEILCDSIWYQTSQQNLDLYVPLIDKYIAKEHGHWDDMLELLQRILHDERINLSSYETEYILKWIDQLTQSDFVSRFKYVEQKQKWDFSTEYDDQIKIEREEYQALAREFAKSYNKENLVQIYGLQALNSEAFGTELAQCLDPQKSKEFINDSITILSIAKRKYNAIFISFGKSVSEDVYVYLRNAIVGTNVIELLFPIIAGRSERMDNEETNFLFDLVKNGNVSVSFFTQYIYSFRFNKMEDEQMSVFLKKIVETRTDDSLITAITIASNFAHWHKDKCRLSMEFIRETMVSQIHELTKPLVDEISFHQIVNTLLQGKSDNEWADWVGNIYANQILIDLSLIQHNPYANETLKILFSQYFELMWAKIEDVYMKADDFTRYRIGLMFGVMQGAVRGGLGESIFTPEHDDMLLAWCSRHPEYAPLYIARMAPLYDKAGQFTHLIQSVINLYGTDSRVLGELSANMGSMLTVGSAVEPHRHQLDVLNPLTRHNLAEVRQWATLMIKDVEKEVKQIQNEEDEITAKYS